ncbi:TetR/AcrR family transcriptional regulator [Paenibacillus mendelii]|uniref:TetR/AcrR family transcriptional regulator n=1 Tax=Paenibacillus mendelii TaxID=206163 RepID=A0ABV6J709_9BACL|nr:TetR/AcrR family transcriptional regulator [Paenibacillus mendelii]MCQ6560959.1 TetR/AcrR family transcriptional regulator [Paenibacillus mendelii]
MPKETAKNRILRVASDLFYREGIRAIGIDRIILESGVAKSSFYRNFASKDDLVAAYLEYHQDLNAKDLDEVQRQHPNSNAMQLHALIDKFVEKMKTPGYRGCPFANTTVEFPDSSHDNHIKAVKGTDENWNRIAILAEKAGAARPLELAELLRMLCNGAIMLSYMKKHDFNPDLFSATAHTLVDSHLFSWTVSRKDD